MNPAKCDEYDYINFLVAAQTVFTSTEAERVGVAAHNAYTRLLQRLPADSNALWSEVAGCINRTEGVLVVDDSTLDKPYARKMSLVTRHWSGKHRRVVQGINLTTLLWTANGKRLPCDFRIYNKSQDGLTKNDHFAAMVEQAHKRRFTPELVLFDSWYSSLSNLKLLRSRQWEWLTQLKANRQVSLTPGQRMAVSEMPIGRDGQQVHLKGYGQVKVFRTVGSNGNAEHWATSRLDMTIQECAEFALDGWQIEVYHHDLKQYSGVERGHYRLEVSQRNHIGLAIRAFVRLEVLRHQTARSHFDLKLSIIRDAIRAYLRSPHIVLPSTA